jgi:hypothetical protein
MLNMIENGKKTSLQLRSSKFMLTSVDKRKT